MDTIASSTRAALKANEPEKLTKKLFGTECMASQLVLAINTFRYKDGRGDPKGFTTFLDNAGLPKGLLPRYRGNRLHILFHICGKLCQHEDFFLKFFEEGTVSCGALQAAIFHDFQSPVARVEIHVLGLIWKLLSGPWMSKFYTSKSTQVSHIDGISIVKKVLTVVKGYCEKPEGTLYTMTDFFGNKLAADDETLVKLKQSPVDEPLFASMMGMCLLKVAEVLERQYQRYFGIDVINELRKQTESARCHNIDAEEVMGMFSAAKEHAPNATMCYLSSRIRAQKNKVVDYLDNLQSEKREKLVNLAISLGRKQRQNKRKRCIQIKEEISSRLAVKLQKKKMYQRNKLEKRLKSPDLDISVEFPELEESIQWGVRDILDGKIVGHRICHVWYDDDSKSKTVYNGKVEKLLKKSGGTYVIGYWSEEETYQDDAVDYDISKYALAADLVCEDLTVS